MNLHALNVSFLLCVGIAMLMMLFVFQCVIVVCLIISVLLQNNAGDGLSGLSGGGGGAASSRASSNIITKATFIFALLFMANSMVLAKLTVLDLQKASELIRSLDAKVEISNDTPSIPISE